MKRINFLLLFALTTIVAAALVIVGPGAGCRPCDDTDGDGTCDTEDFCPDDPNDDCFTGVTCPSGTYVDDFNEVWDMTTMDGNVTGVFTSDQAPDCSWNITGQSSGENGLVQLTLEIDAANPNCCETITFSGNPNDDCSSIAGLASNVCGIQDAPITLTLMSGGKVVSSDLPALLARSRK